MTRMRVTLNEESYRRLMPNAVMYYCNTILFAKKIRMPSIENFVFLTVVVPIWGC